MFQYLSYVQKYPTSIYGGMEGSPVPTVAFIRRWNGETNFALLSLFLWLSMVFISSYGGGSGYVWYEFLNCFQINAQVIHHWRVNHYAFWSEFFSCCIPPFFLSSFFFFCYEIWKEYIVLWTWDPPLNIGVEWEEITIKYNRLSTTHLPGGMIRTVHHTTASPLWEKSKSISPGWSLQFCGLCASKMWSTSIAKKYSLLFTWSAERPLFRPYELFIWSFIQIHAREVGLE